MIDLDSDSPVHRHWLLPAYEDTARRRYLARRDREDELRCFLAWLDDEGPMPEPPEVTCCDA